MVNDVNMLGQSPLHVAATSNDIESARLLLDAGASVHTLDSAGFNPAHVAARWGNGEMLQLFLSRGADVKRKTKRGKNLIELCDEYNHNPIVKNVILSTPNPPIDIRLKWCTKKFEMYVGWEKSKVTRGTAIDRYEVQIRDEQDDVDWYVPSTNKIFETSTTLEVSNLLRLARTSTRKKEAGTPAYMAPELLEDYKTYSTPVDVYAFAMLCWETLCRKIPYEGLDAPSIRKHALRSKRPEIPTLDFPEDCADLIRECWHARAARRPDMKEVHRRLIKFKDNIREVSSLKTLRAGDMDSLDSLFSKTL